MGTAISILVIIVCLLLAGVILVQNSKGGGLASNFSSSNQVMGVRRTADFLEKATWGLAIGLLSLSLFSAAVNSKTEVVGAPQSEIQDLVESSAPLQAPAGFNTNNANPEPAKTPAQ